MYDQIFTALTLYTQNNSLILVRLRKRNFSRFERNFKP
jgi:hypothetical protein